LLRKKTYKLNDFPISILLGERIISHIGKILRDPELDNNEVNKEDLNIMINTLISENPAIRRVSERQDAQDQEIKTIKTEIQNLSKANEEIILKVNGLEAKVASISVTVENSRIENMQAHSNAANKSEELSAMMRQMLTNQITAANQPTTNAMLRRKTKRTEA
jgi:hypothetical protein